VYILRRFWIREKFYISGAVAYFGYRELGTENQSSPFGEHR
jgi:hypothetical protein